MALVILPSSSPINPSVLDALPLPSEQSPPPPSSTPRVTIHSLVEHGASHGIMAVADDGKWVSQGTEFGVFKIWNAQGELISTVTMEETDRYPNQCCFSRDGTKLFIGKSGYPGYLEIVDVFTGQHRIKRNFSGDVQSLIPYKDQYVTKTSCKIEYLDEPQKSLNFGASIECLQISPDETLMVASSGSDIRLFHANDGSLIASLRGGHTQSVWLCCFSKDSQRLATLDETGKLVIWDVSTGIPISSTDCILNTSIYSFSLPLCTFSQEGKYFFMLSHSTITVLDTMTQTIASYPIDTCDRFQGVSKDGSKFWGYGKEKSLSAYDLSSGSPQKIFTLTLPTSPEMMQMIDGDRKIFVSNREGIFILDSMTGNELSRIIIPPPENHHHQDVGEQCPLPHGKWKMADKIWDLETGEFCEEFPISGSISWDRRWLVEESKGPPTELNLWDLEKRTKVRSLPLLENLINGKLSILSRSLSRNMQTMVATLSDKSLCVWDIPQNTFKHCKQPRQKDGHICAVSDDGSWAAIACPGTPTPFLWNLAKGKLCQVRFSSKNAHLRDISRCAFVKQDTQLLTEADDEKTKLWDITTGTCFKTFELDKIKLSLDERWFLHSKGSQISVYEFESGKLLGSYDLAQSFRRWGQVFRGGKVTCCDFVQQSDNTPAIAYGTEKGMCGLIPLSIIFDNRQAPIVQTQSIVTLHNSQEQQESAQLEASARKHFEEKNSLAAIVDWSRLIELNPQQARYYSERAKIRFSLEKHEEALVDWNEAIRLADKDANSYLERANVLLALGRYAEVLQDYNQAIFCASAVAESYFKRSLFFVQHLRNFPAALQDLQKAVSLKPDLPEATSLFDKILKEGFPFNKKPGDLTRTEVLSEALYPCIQRGAVAVLPRGETRSLDMPGFDFTTVDPKVYDERREFRSERQLEEFMDSVYAKQQIQRHQELRIIGRERYTTREWNSWVKKQAKETFASLPFKAKYYSGNYEGAIAQAADQRVEKQGAKKMSIDTISDFQAAIAYQAIGDHSAAIQSLSHLLQSHPKDAGAHLARGRSYMALQQYPQAIEDFDTTLTLRPPMNYPEAYFEWGMAEKALGNLAAAQVNLRAAIQERAKDPTSCGFPLAHFELGCVMNLLGNPASALKCFDTAIDLSPEYADAYFERAKIYRMQGNITFATADFNMTVQYAPLHAEAKEALQELAFHTQRFRGTLSIPSITSPVTIDMDQRLAELQEDLARKVADETLAIKRDVANMYALVTTDPHLSRIQTLEERFLALATLKMERSQEIHEGQARVQQILMEQDQLILSCQTQYQKHEECIHQLQQQIQQCGSDRQGEIISQIEAINAKQELLLQEYYDAQKVKKEQEQIIVDDSLRTCYLQLQTKLNIFFLGWQSVASGQIQRTKSGKESFVFGAIDYLKDAATAIPGASFVLNVFGKGAEYYFDKKAEEKADHISEFAVGVARMEAIVEKIARKMTLHYKKGLTLLSPKGASKIGEYAIRPIIQWVLASETNVVKDEEALIEAMLLAIRSVQPPQTKCAKAQEGVLKTLNTVLTKLGIGSLDTDLEAEFKGGAGACSAKQFLSGKVINLFGFSQDSFDDPTQAFTGLEENTTVQKLNFENQELRGEVEKLKAIVFKHLPAVGEPAGGKRSGMTEKWTGPLFKAFGKKKNRGLPATVPNDPVTDGDLILNSNNFSLFE